MTKQDIHHKIWRCAGTVKIYSIQIVSYNAITALTNKQAGALKPLPAKYSGD